MKWVEQFNCILHDSDVQSQVRYMMDTGSSHRIFNNYFGVNYNNTDIISVKFYFSFLNMPGDEIFKRFGLDEEFKEKIKTHWHPSEEYTYMHQGLTFGLKCYPQDNKIKINTYLHFRTPDYVLGLPQQVELTNEDLKNYPGVCIENNAGKPELKKYYYITSGEAKKNILNSFGISEVLAETDIDIIEYTESDRERKINLIIPRAENVTKVIAMGMNEELRALNRHFFEKHKLYYYGPGMRLNSNIKALYYVPKEHYYKHNKISTINSLLE